MPQAEVGEIACRTAGVRRLLEDKPEANGQTFRDGWMHTGDLAREDQDGLWYIVDRTKDMIVTGGFNVFPREVEDVVAERPSSRAGLRHRHAGREMGRGGDHASSCCAPTRRVTTEPVSKVTAEIQSAVKERKGLQLPQAGDRSSTSVPITALGKPDKAAVRAQFWEGASRAVG